ncbi:hypothetical protein [Tabrizicola sp.]|uniref:hypothetical protein n=1 Tax=Tabrizicola sp. TaxID=2005166 RepID=UPI00286AF885|nr:hypothetical protein [Tabrizicola sp.]
MYGHLVAMAVVAGAVAAAVSWLVAARYGVRWALTIPLLALLGALSLLWKAEGMGFHEGLGLAAGAVVFALPTLVGAGIGIVLQVMSRNKHGSGKP